MDLRVAGQYPVFKARMEPVIAFHVERIIGQALPKGGDPIRINLREVLYGCAVQSVEIVSETTMLLTVVLKSGSLEGRFPSDHQIAEEITEPDSEEEEFRSSAKDIAELRAAHHKKEDLVTDAEGRTYRVMHPSEFEKAESPEGALERGPDGSWQPSKPLDGPKGNFILGIIIIGVSVPFALITLHYVVKELLKFWGQLP